TLLTVIALLGVCLLVMPFVSFVFFWLVLVIWGVLSWAIPPPVQGHLSKAAPGQPDFQQTLTKEPLHLGIAFGTFIGSIIADLLSVKQNAFIGVLFVILALGSAFISLQKERKVA